MFSSTWIAEIVGFPKLLGKARFSKRLPKVTDALFIKLVGSICKYRLLRQCSICQISRISEDILHMPWQLVSWFAELVGFPKMFTNVRFSRKLSEIAEDAIFAELGGFPKINNLLRQHSICQISRMTKDMVDTISCFLEGYPRCSKFSEVHKRSEKIPLVSSCLYFQFNNAFRNSSEALNFHGVCREKRGMGLIKSE